MTEVPIADIVVNRTTPVDPATVDALAKIMAEEPMIPVVIDRYGTLIDGLVRLRAAQQLGWTKVEANVVQTLEQAMESLRGINPRELTPRRMYDLSEAIEQLIVERRTRIRAEYDRKRHFNTAPAPAMRQREFVAMTLGSNWDRARRVYRWAADKPDDPDRVALIAEVDSGKITVNQAYNRLGQRREKNKFIKDPEVGDVAERNAQLHLLAEVERQLSGVVKAAQRLGSPLVVDRSKVYPLLAGILRSRQQLSSFIKFVRAEMSKTDE